MLIKAEILHHYQSGFQGGLEAQPILPTIKFISCGTGRKACSQEEEENQAGVELKLLLISLLFDEILLANRREDEASVL